MTEKSVINTDLKHNEQKMDKLSQVEIDLNVKLEEWCSSKDFKADNFNEILPNIEAVLKDIKIENETNLQETRNHLKRKLLLY